MQQLENKDILVIVNPNSGKKNTAKILKEINSLVPKISNVITHNVTDLENVFQINIEKYKAFIIVGGDGSVNETIKYLHNRNDKLLGVLPAGSGNGFARELGFKKSIHSLIQDTKKGETLDIDVLSVNGINCINVAGLGFDSFVAHDFQKRNSRGLKTYVISVIKSLFAFKAFRATLFVDKEKIEGRFQMITVANTRQFGNNAIIAPLAKPNDGILDLVLVKPFPFYIYPIFILRMFSGTLKESKNVRYIKVKNSLEIESDFKNFHVDGEPKTFTNKLSVEILKDKVRVLKTEHCRY